MNSPTSTLTDGMFAILVPASLSPLIVTLFWAEQKAKKLGLLEAPPLRPDLAEPPVQVPFLRTWWTKAWTFAQQLDIVGLVLIGTSVALILLPLTLAQGAKGQWDNRMSFLVASLAQIGRC